MSQINKAYNPSEVEDKWYFKWLQNGCFKGKADASKEAYSIVIPPPNVTGVLTMGHVLNNTIQDILIRRARQSGKSAVWIPGTDHAGVATQTKVNAQLRSEGTSAAKLGREKFMERACDWRDKHGGIILEQLKKLGASCDWDRLAHTLDDDYSKGVLQAFVHLYKKGYIYRGKRMVNWCPVNLTALSDEEVNMVPMSSKLYKFRYEIADSNGQYLEVSTTRPETIMGDTAVAVNPKDERYKHLIGKKCIRPFATAQIPIIGDEYVDMEFGTGVLKVTPAHDLADFEIGQRHNLPIVDVMNPDGTMNALAGAEFEGLDRFKARNKAEKLLEEMGLLIKVENYENKVGYSERGNVPIEPRLSDQWFMRYPKIEEAKKVVSSGMIKFWPQRWEKTYLHWLENIKDWCISRQIWWGHRIPVWYKKGVENPDLNNPDEVHVSVEGPQDPENWVQDEDSLDTWASSWIWPFATMGWPNAADMKKDEFNYFYPTSDLVTGPDIIFFWVARMIMAGLEFLDGSDEQKIPFKNVYFTGIIRDMKGRKMSKSLGNSPDPLDLIAKYGADGLRFGVMNSAPQGQDILFSEDRVELGRNFCNKLWNACRFRQMSGESFDSTSLEKILSRIDKSKLDNDDYAVLQSLINTTCAVEKDYAVYQFNSVTQNIYAFFWNDFCDWYLEVSKTRLSDESAKQTILAIQDLCLRQTLLLLHPFMPFITEELWHSMGFGKEESFIQNESCEFAQALEKMSIKIDASCAQITECMQDFTQKARSLKAQYKLATKRDCTFYMIADAQGQKILEANVDKLKKLIGAQEICIKSECADSPAVLTKLGTLYLDLSGSVDTAAEKEKLSKEKQKLEGLINSTQARLSNEAFTSKAPKNVIEGAQKQLEDYKGKIAEIDRLLASM